MADPGCSSSVSRQNKRPWFLSKAVFTPKLGGELLVALSVEVGKRRGRISRFGLLELCCRFSSGCALGLRGFAPELFSKEARSTGCLYLFFCWWEEERRSSSPFCCKTSSRLPFCRRPISQVLSSEADSLGSTSGWSSVPCLWGCAWCWSWQRRVRGGCGMVWHCPCAAGQHLGVLPASLQTFSSSSWLEIRQPAPCSCRQGKEK